MNKKAALYVRVSTLHQIDKDSLPFQKKDLENYAKYALNIDDVEIFEDAGYSAKNTDRPKYQEMMSRIRNKEFTHLIVWKIDRISRNLKDFTEMYEELKEYDITFVSKNEQFDTSSAMGEAMLKIILVFAELERELASERVMAIMLARAEQGLWNGATVPLGYVWNDFISFPVEEPNEVKVVRKIFNMYENLKSTTKVAHKLNEKYVPTKRGGKWTAKTIRGILRNPFYIGTYRYNLRKNDKKRRLKDKSEWVVVEDNHPAIIDKKQFEKVNTMLSQNYRGNVNVQREDMHYHIFGKRLYCHSCNELMTAGLDRARKDGYRPSRYTCMSFKKHANCKNYMSDLVIGPFIFNFVSNLIRLQERITPKHTQRDIERALLRGSPFIDIKGIDKQSLKQLQLSITGQSYEYDKNMKSADIMNIDLERLEKERRKFTTALDRLKDLYLFSDDSMSKKDYTIKKSEIEQKLNDIEIQISSLDLVNPRPSSHVFVNNARFFIVSKEMQQARNIDFRGLSQVVEKEILADFIDSIIDEITVVDKKVKSISFKNAMTLNFNYNNFEDSKNLPRKRLQYKNYEDLVLDYLKENGPASRTDLQKRFNMSRHAAHTLLNDLLERQIVGKTGKSVAIRYHLNEKLI